MIRQLRLSIAGLAILIGWLFISAAHGADEWPSLPNSDETVILPAQEWPLRPGPRTIEVSIHYPNGRLDDVTAKTGLMLTLHNWGGTLCVGTADPNELAQRLNVIALCVDYLQTSSTGT